MTKKPILNALLAALYIVIVASLMFYGQHVVGEVEDTIFAPIAMMSLFTLSAAVMGYIFLLEPLKMYLDGEKKESVRLFFLTIVFFAIFTIIFFTLLLSGLDIPLFK